jgi:hypothetical protein
MSLNKENETKEGLKHSTFEPDLLFMIFKDDIVKEYGCKNIELIINAWKQGLMTKEEFYYFYLELPF